MLAMKTSDSSLYWFSWVLYVFLSGLVVKISDASAATLKSVYTADYLSDTIYSVNVDGGYQSVIKIPGNISIIDLKLLNDSTLFVLGSNDSNLYAVDLISNTYRLITSTPIGSGEDLLYSIGIADENTGYAIGYLTNTIYSIDLNNGTSSALLSLSGDPGLTTIGLLNNSTAYVVGYRNNNLYKIDLNGATYSLVTPTSVGSPASPHLEGIAVADSSIAYVVGNTNGLIYQVNLENGSTAQVTPTQVGTPLIDLAINENTGYTVNNLGDEVYAINLSDGSSQVFATIPGTNLAGITLFLLSDPTPISPSLQIPTTGLAGNSLRLANYLNDPAPNFVLSSFLGLTTTELTQALIATSPARNACITYASQNGYLAFSHLLADHVRQKRFHYSQNIGSLDCKPSGPSTIWASPFGGYTHLQSQNQTPAFGMSFGGATVGFDFNGINHNLLGCSATYAYTDVQEGNQTGSGDVNQGWLTFYGTASAKLWYADFELSGGYYHGESLRNIVFSEVNETTKCHPQGWQFAPHLEIGYDGFAQNGCSSSLAGLEPFLLLDWVANWEASLTEKGGEGLNMGQESRFCSLFDGEFGFRVHEKVEVNNGQFVFREKFAYSCQKAFNTGSIQAYLLGSTSPDYFTIKTLNEWLNLGVIELAMLYQGKTPTSPYFDFRYEGEFGSGYQFHQGVVEIGKNF